MIAPGAAVSKGGKPGTPSLLEHGVSEWRGGGTASTLVSQVESFPKFRGFTLDLGTKPREKGFCLLYRQTNSPVARSEGREGCVSGTSPLTKGHRLLPQENATLLH